MLQLPRSIRQGFMFLLALGVLSGVPNGVGPGIRPQAYAVTPAGSHIPASHPASASELGYLPGELIVKFTEDGVQALTADDKGEPALSTWSSLSRLNKQYQVAGIEQVFRTVGHTAVDQRYGLSRIYSLKIPPHTDIWAMAQDYAALPGVVYAEPNRIARNALRCCLPAAERPAWFSDDGRLSAVNPNDPRFGEQWNFHNTGQTGGTADADVDAPEAWDITTGSADVLIAVLDTGLDYAHPDLAPKVRTDIDWDFHDGDNDASDPGEGLTPGHGTRVASVAAAASDDDVGIAGMCWGCQLLSIRVGGFVGHLGSKSVAQGIVYAAYHGAKVISMSLGGQCSRLWADAVNYAYDQGVVLVAAAGNHFWYQPMESVAYPAKFARVIAVAATDHNDAQADFSNYGPEVDVAAPGVDVLHAELGGGWKIGSGTSYATPHVAGLAGLLLSLHSDLTPEQVRQILRDSADDLGPVGPDKIFGSGRINAAAALSAEIPTAPPVPEDACGCVLKETIAASSRSRTGEESQALDTFYKLRDQVLATSPRGRRYTRLYYRHSPELAGLLLRDQQLRTQTITFLRKIQPSLEAVTDGNSKAVLSHELIEEGEALVHAIARRASPELRRTLLAEWQALDLWQYEGQPLRAVWERVQ